MDRLAGRTWRHGRRVRALVAMVLLAAPLALLVGWRIPARRAVAGLLPGAARLDGIIEFDRAPRVYSPAETVAARVRVRLSHPRKPVEKAARVSLKWKLTAAGKFHALAEGATTLTARWNAAEESAAIEFRAPNWSGVATFELRVSGIGIPDAEEALNLVILGDDALPGSPLPATATLVDEFDGSHRAYFRKVSVAWGAIPREQRFGRLLKGNRPDDEAGRQADDSFAGLETRAFRLKANHALLPHKLVVNVRSRPGQVMELAILEPARDRELAPNGPVQRICPRSEGWPAEGTAAAAGVPVETEHVLVFWPNGRDVLLAARGAGPGFDVVRARLYEFDTAGPAAAAAAAAGGESAEPRLCAGAAELFCRAANMGLGAPGRDFNWESSLQAAVRAAGLLRLQGHNALLLKLPAEALEPAAQPPRAVPIGSGAGRAMGAIDALVLTAWVFDRQGLALVPELDLTGRLAEIEQHVGPSTWLRDAQGRRWSGGDTGTGAPPGYNALDPLVQQAVAALVDRLCGLLADRRSFVGLALRLGPESCLQLPSLQWGYEPETLERFLEQTDVKLPPGPADRSTEALADAVLHTARQPWLQWRCRNVAAFHRELAAVVTRHVPHGRLYLTGAGPLVGASLGAEAVIDAARRAGNPLQTLAAQGLDFSRYQSSDRIVVLRPLLEGVAGQTLQTAACNTLNAGPGIHAAYRAGEVGAQFIPVERPAGPVQRPMEEPWSVALPPAEESLRRLGTALAAFDAVCLFEGGDVLSTRLVEPVVRQRKAVARLPRLAFAAVEPGSQPVVVRWARTADRGYVWAVNSGVAACGLDLSLECRPRTAWTETLSGRRVRPAARPAGQQGLSIMLEPGQTLLLECEDPGVKIAQVASRYSAEAVARMQRRLDDLHQRLAALDETAARGEKVLATRAEHEISAASLRPASGLTAEELKQLAKTLSSARLAIEESRYADCQRLLDGYWGQLAFEGGRALVAREPTAEGGSPRR